MEYTHLRWLVGKWGNGNHVHVVRETEHRERGNFNYSVQCTEETMRGGRTSKNRVSGIGEELTTETAKKVTCKRCLHKIEKMIEHAARFQEFEGSVEEWDKKYGRLMAKK